MGPPLCRNRCCGRPAHPACYLAESLALVTGSTRDLGPGVMADMVIEVATAARRRLRCAVFEQRVPNPGDIPCVLGHLYRFGRD